MADPKQIARSIFQQTLASIDIPLAMERRVLRSGHCLEVDDWSCDLRNISDVRVIALGKASHAMLRSFAQLFSGVPLQGVACAPTPPENPIADISYFLGGHPLPNEHSISFCASRSRIAQELH